MKITINGREHKIDQAKTISELLDEMRVQRPGTAVALNGAIVPSGRHEAQPVADGDRIDILRPIGGG